MLSSCTLVSCASSQKGLSHNSQPALKESGTKTKRQGCKSPKTLRPKNLPSPGEPGSLLGARGQPCHSS